MKLEAGKTYVFIDDAAKTEYERGHIQNKGLVDVYYNNGFNLDFGCDKGGLCGTELVITDNEIHLFKESKPFDIREYKFSDTIICNYANDGFIKIDTKSESFIGINKQDAEAIAKHFKLI